MTDYSLDSKFAKKLDEDILEFVQQGVNYSDEEKFNEIALREFELQFNANEPYKQFCLEKRVVPGSIDKWVDIPPIPSQAFKELIIASFPLEKTALAYTTGGTSSPNRRGRIYRDERAVELVYEANGLVTKSYLFPDVDKMKILLMVPSPQMVPSMGMAVGLEQVRVRFGTTDSAYLISFRGLDAKTLLNSLKRAEKTGEPIALIGATTGFIYFLNACEKEGVRFNLSKGSRICDGGGYMGRFGEITREEYYYKCEKMLGIPYEYCVNTLGMGECSTNYFDNVLRDNYLGVRFSERYKVAPPWTRTIVVDTETFERLPRGEIGLLCHYDIVNRAMVFAVQTDNLGYETEKGFEIIGRAKPAKGKISKVPSGEPVGHAGGPPGKLARRISSYIINRQMSAQVKALAEALKKERKAGVREEKDGQEERN